MKAKIEALFRDAQSKGTGLLAAGFMDLTTGETAYLNPDTAFPTASVFKIFVLCQLFKMKKAGIFDLSQKHILQESEKSIGSGELEKVPAGTEFTMLDYVMLMMSISDNTATDYLCKRAGFDNIRKNIIEPLDLTATKCHFGCMDLLTRYYGVTLEEYRDKCAGTGWFDAHMGSYFRCTEEKNNQTSPRDLIKLLSLMNEGKVVDAENDLQMLDIMAQCKTNSRIPAKLPEGTRVEHKTGTIDRLANDAGIVRTPKGDYILVYSYNGNVASREEYTTTKRAQVGDAILSQLSLDVYNTYLQNK